MCWHSLWLNASRDKEDTQKLIPTLLSVVMHILFSVEPSVVYSHSTLNLPDLVWTQSALAMWSSEGVPNLCQMTVFSVFETVTIGPQTFHLPGWISCFHQHFFWHNFQTLHSAGFPFCTNSTLAAALLETEWTQHSRWRLSSLKDRN